MIVAWRWNGPRERGFTATTVLPCIIGFGAKRVVESEMNEISSLGMPVIVEPVQDEDRIAAEQIGGSEDDEPPGIQPAHARPTTN